MIEAEVPGQLASSAQKHLPQKELREHVHSNLSSPCHTGIQLQSVTPRTDSHSTHAWKHAAQMQLPSHQPRQPHQFFFQAQQQPGSDVRDSVERRPDTGSILDHDQLNELTRPAARVATVSQTACAASPDQTPEIAPDQAQHAHELRRLEAFQRHSLLRQQLIQQQELIKFQTMQSRQADATWSLRPMHSAEHAGESLTLHQLRDQQSLQQRHQHQPQHQVQQRQSSRPETPLAGSARLSGPSPQSSPSAPQGKHEPHPSAPPLKLPALGAQQPNTQPALPPASRQGAARACAYEGAPTQFSDAFRPICPSCFFSCGSPSRYSTPSALLAELFESFLHLCCHS